MTQYEYDSRQDNPPVSSQTKTQLPPTYHLRGRNRWRRGRTGKNLQENLNSSHQHKSPGGSTTWRTRRRPERRRKKGKDEKEEEKEDMEIQGPVGDIESCLLDPGPGEEDDEDEEEV